MSLMHHLGRPNDDEIPPRPPNYSVQCWLIWLPLLSRDFAGLTRMTKQLLKIRRLSWHRSLSEWKRKSVTAVCVCVAGTRGIRNLRGTLSAFGGGRAWGGVQTDAGSTNWLLAVYQRNWCPLIGAGTRCQSTNPMSSKGDNPAFRIFSFTPCGLQAKSPIGPQCALPST